MIGARSNFTEGCASDWGAGRGQAGKRDRHGRSRWNGV